jgi:hypothetical protein
MAGHWVGAREPPLQPGWWGGGQTGVLLMPSAFPAPRCTLVCHAHHSLVLVLECWAAAITTCNRPLF